MRTRKAILPDAQDIHELICAYSGDGTLLQMGFNIDSTGLVSCSVSYYKTSQQDRNDGILLVMVHASAKLRRCLPHELSGLSSR